MNIEIDYFINEYREKGELSIRELSRLSGISKTHINDIENKKYNPSVLVLCQLAVALKVSPSHLFKHRIT